MTGSGGERIPAAVVTKHSVEMKPVEIPIEDLEPQIIEVEGGALPLEIHFKSSSSRIRVHQTHESAGAGQVEQTSSEEEPHRLIHEVKKPIIQEVREIITPFRRVIQEIQPVMEEIHTIVAKGEQKRVFDRNQSKARTGGSLSGAGLSSPSANRGSSGFTGSFGASGSGNFGASGSGNFGASGSGSFGGGASIGSSGSAGLGGGSLSRGNSGGGSGSGGFSSFSQQTFEQETEQKSY
ncbi:DFP2-like protein 38 [Sarcoptes scabiei]|uniref:DFP2-like protein 38 n=1 Tax=Sarcoptes scabiei TaxID=52283 RepID=A0A132AJ13_SARSC|nr:DFP2-like protein 38 [Sarcoptes scabiei]